ncbi:hypothetical protein MRX96_043408 [Rhipicephalus microplus]
MGQKFPHCPKEVSLAARRRRQKAAAKYREQNEGTCRRKRAPSLPPQPAMAEFGGRGPCGKNEEERRSAKDSSARTHNKRAQNKTSSLQRARTTKRFPRTETGGSFGRPP